MRPDAHSTETKAKAEADSCLPQAGLVVWLLGMTGKKGKRAEHKGRRACTARAGQAPPLREARQESKSGVEPPHSKRKGPTLRKRVWGTRKGQPWAGPCWEATTKRRSGRNLPAQTSPAPLKPGPPEVRSAFVRSDRRYRAEGVRSTPLACCCDENKRMRARGGCVSSNIGFTLTFQRSTGCVACTLSVFKYLRKRSSAAPSCGKI